MVEFFVGDRVYIVLLWVYWELVLFEVNYGIVGVGFVW